MRKIPLSELVISKGPKAKHEVDLPVYSVTKHDGFVPSLEYFSKQVFSRDIANYRVVEAGDFAYATIHLDEGSIGIAPVRSLISPMYTVFGIDSTRVEPRFLLAYLKSDRALAFYNLVGRGAIHRRRSISLKALGELLVPLPDLSEQRRIADILDKADALRAKRQKVLDNLDALTQSIFHDMFGDPRMPTGEHEVLPIGSVSTVITGNTPSRKETQNFGSALEWVKSDDLGPIHPRHASEHLSQEGIARARVAPAGSVLVTCIAGSPRSIGKCSVADRAVAFNQQINAVLPSRDIRPEFLYWQLRSFPDLVRAKSTGGMKGLVSKSSFKEIQILKPKIRSQDEFVTWTSKIARLVEVADEQLGSIGELGDALAGSAFAGAI